MILTLIESGEGEPTEESTQTLTLARDIADQLETGLHTTVFGGEDHDTGALGHFGVDELHRITHDRLDRYAPAAFGESIDQLVTEIDASTVIGPGTERTHEILAHFASRKDLPMAANCLSVTAGEHFEVRRQRWGGSLLEDARLTGDPKILTVPPHEIEIEPVSSPTSPTVSDFTPTLADNDLRVRVGRREAADSEGIPLGEARVVIGGGRGVGGPDGYDQLEELADLLGGTVGASRAAVNEGWRPHDDQIGLTGAKISPEIYIACGISGAVQHMVGCKGAKHILAINTDPEAAIVQKADWAIIGDLHEVVPTLCDSIRENR